MFNRYIRLTALLIAVIPVLIACQKGSSILIEFPNTATSNLTDNCDDSLNGDWMLQSMHGKGNNSGTIPPEIKNRALIRFKIDRGCEKNTFTFAFRKKGALEPQAVLSTKIKFPLYKIGTFFSLSVEVVKRNRNRHLILKYRFLDNDTLEIALVNKTFIINAIRKKLIPGTLTNYGSVNITATPAQMERFIEKHSDAIFSLKMIYIRTQQTPWSFRSVIKTF